MGSHYVVQFGLSILLPRLPNCWDYSHSTPPILTRIKLHGLRAGPENPDSSWLQQIRRKPVGGESTINVGLRHLPPTQEPPEAYLFAYMVLQDLGCQESLSRELSGAPSVRNARLEAMEPLLPAVLLRTFLHLRENWRGSLRFQPLLTSSGRLFCPPACSVIYIAR